MRLSLPIQMVLLGTLACHGCATPGNRTKAVPSSAALSENEIQLDRVLSLARLHERQKKTAEAIKLYENVLEQDPQNALAHHRLGVVMAAHGEFEDAHKHFAVALSSGRPSAELLNDVGYVYYLQSDFPSAEARFREALRVDIQSKQARTNLGLALGFQQRFEESLDQFQRAGSEADAYNNLAFVQSQLGHVDLAVASYHRSLNLNPQQRPAAEALVQLTKAQNKEQSLAAAGTSQPPTRGEGKSQVVAAPTPANRAEMAPRQPEEIRHASYESPLPVATSNSSDVVPHSALLPPMPATVLPVQATSGSQQTAVFLPPIPASTPPNGVASQVVTGQSVGNQAPAAPSNSVSDATVNTVSTEAAREAAKAFPAVPRALPAWVPMNFAMQTPTPASPTRMDVKPGMNMAPVVTPDSVRRSQIPVPVATPNDYWSMR